MTTLEELLRLPGIGEMQAEFQTILTLYVDQKVVNAFKRGQASMKSATSEIECLHDRMDALSISFSKFERYASSQGDGEKSKTSS